MRDKFGFLSIVDFGATIWYIFPPNAQCIVIHRCHLILFLNEIYIGKRETCILKLFIKSSHLTVHIECSFIISIYVRLSKSGLGYTTIH